MAKKQNKNVKSVKQEQKKDFLPLAEKAHSIKNILQAISGGINVVDKGLETGDTVRAKRAWSILKNNLERISDLVLAMLEFSRESRLVLSSGNINEVVESVIKAVRPYCDEKSVAVETSLDNITGFNEIDVEKMHEALLNLIINALEAVDAKKGKIKVSTIKDDFNSRILIKVQDNGPGVSDTETVFLPFHSSKTKHSAGLGLSLSRKIVELHNGTITAKNKANAGAEFIITLPCPANQQKQ